MYESSTEHMKAEQMLQSSSDTDNKSSLNPKFRPIKGEFVYKQIPWASWTTEYHIRRVEQEFTFNPSDIILASYPKSGVTWVSEIVSLLHETQGSKHRLREALGFAGQTYVHDRVLFLEEAWSNIYPGSDQPELALDYLSRHDTGPRLIKTHLPFRFVRPVLDRADPNGGHPRIVYVFRNPKDTAVSMFHFYRGCKDYGPFDGQWEEFFEMWLDGWIASGDWRVVIPEWLEAMRHVAYRSCIYPLSYERLSHNPRECVADLFNHLFPSRTLDPEVLDTVVECTSFGRMRANPMVNHETCDSFAPGFRFMRQGRVGGWTKRFTVEQNRRHDLAYADAVDKVNRLLVNTSEQCLKFE